VEGGNGEGMRRNGRVEGLRRSGRREGEWGEEE